MHSILSSILISLRLAKIKERPKEELVDSKTKSKDHQFTFPIGFEHLEDTRIQERDERHRHERIRIYPAILFLVAGMIIIIVFVLFSQYGTTIFNGKFQHQLSSEEVMNNKIDAMTCAEQKQYVESHLSERDSTSGPPFVYRAWMEYNGTHWFNVHGTSCHGQLGYLLGDETEKFCKLNQYYNTCDFWFPRDQNGVVQFPSDWYYVDSSGHKIVDPQEYFQIEGVNLKGVISQ